MLKVSGLPCNPLVLTEYSLQDFLLRRIQKDRAERRNFFVARCVCEDDFAPLGIRDFVARLAAVIDSGFSAMY